MIKKISFKRLLKCVGVAVLSSMFLAACQPEENSTKQPEVIDRGLQIELIAANPDIVTPIGMAFDSDDVLYILESHTHSPPRDYPGPDSDRIKKAIDQDNDGSPDVWQIFADGIINGTNLVIDEEHTVFITTKEYLLSFKDLDQDGRSDLVDTLVVLDPPEYIYDHAGLLGIAISQDQWIYVSRGNLGGKVWKLTGADSTILEGYGGGGLVFRCRKDGSGLETICSGFWNPFDLRFTHDGRLLATDNDPDSRGPNRLLELVRGGDYGFKCLYGGSGLHPFVAWNGELPGTLPFAAPLGEAPCALIDAEFTNFGDEYKDHILVNVWEEKNIVRIQLQPSGSTVVGNPEILVQGDTSFHPVALATDSEGNLYISDWVQRHYPNHGQGKIWKLSSRSPVNPQSTASASLPINRMEPLPGDIDTLLEVLQSGDRFQQAMARSQLRKDAYLQEMSRLMTSSDSGLRLQALLVYTLTDVPLEESKIKALLRDHELQIRKMALMYVGRKMRVDLWDELKNILTAGLIGHELFEIYLATIQHLQPEFINNHQNRTGISADKQKQSLPERFIESILENDQIPEPVIALGLPYLRDLMENRDLLLTLLRSAKDESFKINLIKAVRQLPDEEVAAMLLALAKNEKEIPTVRAQAISALFYQRGEFCADLKENLIQSKEEIVLYSLIKILVNCTDDQQLVDEVSNYLASLNNADLLNVWQKGLGEKTNDFSKDDWINTVDGQGVVHKGKLVFESIQSQCQTCHKIDGWGGIIGPDLSNVGSSKTRMQLINSVLDPSLEIAPEWQGWYVIDQHGKKHIGRQIDVNPNRAELMSLAGDFDNFDFPKGFGVLDESIMPSGLQNTITLSEFSDLIAYLESLK